MKCSRLYSELLNVRHERKVRADGQPWGVEGPVILRLDDPRRPSKALADWSCFSWLLPTGWQTGAAPGVGPTALQWSPGGNSHLPPGVPQPDNLPGIPTEVPN